MPDFTVAQARGEQMAGCDYAKTVALEAAHARVLRRIKTGATIAGATMEYCLPARAFMNQSDGSTRSEQEVVGDATGEQDVRLRPAHARANGDLAASNDESACPHVDRDDPRCAHRLSLNRIEQAFNVCFGSYRGCPVFQRIAAGEPLAHDLARSFVEIRIVARPRLRRLRPTGS